MEFFLCDSNDLDDPDGVVTQVNKAVNLESVTLVELRLILNIPLSRSRRFDKKKTWNASGSSFSVSADHIVQSKRGT